MEFIKWYDLKKWDKACHNTEQWDDRQVLTFSHIDWRYAKWYDEAWRIYTWQCSEYAKMDWIYYPKIELWTYQNDTSNE